MTGNEILLLLKAGYTRQEIDAMTETPAPDPVPEQIEMKQTPDPLPEQVQTPDPTPAPAAAGNAEILAAINALGEKFLSAFQAANLGAAMMKSPAPDDLAAVMAQIIPPTPPTK